MAKCLQDGGVERHDELHVDRIDEAWRPPSKWFAAGAAAYNQAISVRDANAYPVSVALVISLESDVQPRGIDFHTTDDLERELGQSPPSLYLFYPGKEPWVEGQIEEYSRMSQQYTVQKIAAELFHPLTRATECFYMEFKPNGEDIYSRSVFVAG